MAEYLPRYQPGQTFTLQASATVTAGQLLEVTGSGTVGPAGASSLKAVGVAAYDGVSGDKISVFAGGVQKIVADTGGVTAGDILQAGAAGTVKPIAAAAFGTKIGIALTTAVAGAVVDCQMDR